MKKKYPATSKDKSDWIAFTKQINNIENKDIDLLENKIKNNKVPKLDLHGFNLNQANKAVKKFIMESFEGGYKKLLIVTGKGSRSQVYHDPYRSEKMNVLKYSIPDYIKKDEDLLSKVTKVSKADIRHGGEGAIYVFLRIEKTL